VNNTSNTSELFSKYDVPVPRYTSYPTVPFWEKTPSKKEWTDSIRDTLDSDNSKWSLYIHLPFCESLCWFCGCTTVITKSHSQEDVYVNAIKKELSTYLKEVPELKTSDLVEIHFGGGTPTFFAPEKLDQFLSFLFENTKINKKTFTGSIEIDPRVTKKEHLEVLAKYGFSRVSLGVQDFDPAVQKAVNRIQTFEKTKDVIDWSRDLGFKSVNVDLIYGLPLQTIDSISSSIEKTLTLRPERIAFYAFAHLPWMKPAHGVFSEIPGGKEKRELYEVGRDLLIKGGYDDIGMDHFALPADELSTARENKTLHRNFMGYTVQKSDLLIGIGMSSISESHGAYHQNEKNLSEYLKTVSENEIPTLRGHLLTKEDIEQKEIILSLMTELKTLCNEGEFTDIQLDLINHLKEDGLITISDNLIQITELGRAFLRNICSVFDLRLLNKKDSVFDRFSKAI